MENVHKLKSFYTNKFTFIILLVTVTVLSHNILEYNKKIKISEHLNIITEQTELKYKVIYEKYKSIANLIYKSNINNNEVLEIFESRNREKLQKYLTNKYNILREFNVRQLHFHLPNNDSFLRMHRPNKFGDNLTKDRSTVAYVNQNKKFIDGFEEGKIFNGFRFVYPLFSKNKKHIGSVEISYSSLFFIKDMVNTYKIKSNFLIDSRVVDEKVFKSEKSNYMQSPLKDYYLQKTIVDYLKSSNLYKENNRKIFTDEISKRLKNGETFSVYNKNNTEIVTFISIKNAISGKPIAAISVNEKDFYIKNKIKNDRFLFLSLVLFFTSVLFIIYKQLNYQNNLKKEIEKKAKEIEHQNVKLFEIEKQASIGELIGNIAHHWRQPLSIISTSASGMQMEKQMGVLTDEHIDKYLEAIMLHTDKLSNTIKEIDIFSNTNNELVYFKVSDVIKKSISFIEANIQSKGINIILDLDDKIHLDNYQTSFIKSIINILNNSVDALTNIDGEKIIILTLTNISNEIKVTIQDNGGGVNEDILPKIFEAYSSTKHAYSGTGLGMYSTYNMIVNEMGCNIVVSNETFEYNNTKFNGAKVKIILKNHE